MSAKRKDKKGRVLRTGESQRKDLTYQYRYQDVTGKRRTVYAPTLEELR
ncbi:MAG: integrase DNA-binding domain-containing protein, partial [Oscillospiraceae bacterium]|nr:integrase DNA-binding domain-containing protein [Oscillospiraceae bacterium]